MNKKTMERQQIINRRSLMLIFIICIAQIVELKVEAQELSTISFSDTLTVQEINTHLRQGNIPFFISVDSISNNRISDIDNIIYYMAGNEYKEIFRYDSSAEGVESISTISNKQNLIYRMIIGEYLVGFDRFLIFNPETLVPYLSEKYNYEQIPHSFLNRCINLKRGTLRIKFINGKYKIINFYKII